MNTKKIKILIAVILLLLIVFVGIMPRHRYEMFSPIPPSLLATQAADSTESLYYKTTDYASFDKKVSQIYNTLVDATNSIMTLKRCYAIPGAKLEQLTDLPLYVKSFGVYTRNFADVENKIYQTLLAFADNQPTKLINGDVYILLSQQPYYRNVDGTNISLDATTINSRNNYATPMYTNKSVIDTQPIYYYIQVIFAAYDKKGSYNKCSDYFKYIMNILDEKYYSTENQCFITTVGDNSKFGGCATSTANSASENSKTAANLAGTKPYDSICLGPVPGQPNEPKIYPTTYVMLYIINQKYNMAFNLSAIFDQKDKCKMINNMPNTDPLIAPLMKYPRP